MRHKGRISDWHDDRGFGFITPALGGARVFVHIKSFANRDWRPAGNEIVTYDLTRDPKGRPQGENVKLSGDRSRRAAGAEPGSAPFILAAGFLAFVAGAAAVGSLPPAVPGLYIIVSVIAGIVYARDKHAARNDRRRVPESTLHLLGLAGGWPGALVAQRVLRHKSRKRSFRVAFWATVVLNCGGLAWMLAGLGSPLG